MEKLLALTLALLMAVSLVACGDDDQEREDLKNYLQNEEVINFVTLESGETYYFDQVDSETVTITSYKCSNEKHALVIPDQLNGKTVVGISDQAFKANNDITSITIPATVTEIGDFVFAECAQVTEVTIPASVTSLGKYIFTNCTALETVTIESTKIEEIKEFSFYGCTALTEITIPANIKKVGTAAFLGCKNVTSVEVKSGVEVIGQQAFQNCTALASLKLPASLVEIGKQAFSGAPNLYIDGLVLENGATVAEAYFATEGYQLFERPLPEEDEGTDGAPATGYRPANNGLVSYLYPAAWGATTIPTDAADLVTSYIDAATGNSMIVALMDADMLATDYSKLSTQNFAATLQPVWEELGAEVSNVTVNQFRNAQGMRMTKVTFENATAVPGKTVKQTLAVYSDGTDATVILFTETVPADGVMTEILKNIDLVA